MKTFMLRAGASKATAEEIAQETMLTVWREANSFVPDSNADEARLFLKKKKKKKKNDGGPLPLNHVSKIHRA